MAFHSTFWLFLLLLFPKITNGMDTLIIQATTEDYEKKVPWNNTNNSYVNDYGVFEGICPEIANITTSSELDSLEYIHYKRTNLNWVYDGKTDNKIANAWVEGVKGDGIGQHISFKFTALMPPWEYWEFSGFFTFVNGYAKSEHTWKNNGRVKQFKLSRNGTFVAYVNVIDSPYVQRLNLRPIFVKSKLKIGDILEFEIASVYKGEKYTDTAITLLTPNCAP